MSWLARYMLQMLLRAGEKNEESTRHGGTWVQICYRHVDVSVFAQILQTKLEGL
jgi:hypothetical protein